MPTVLVVDDNHFFLRMERILLERAGFQVFSAEDGAQGYDIFQRLGSRVDLVVTDQMMPKMGGDQLCTKIKAENPGIPVVLVSGVSTESRAGFDATVHKPLETGFIELVKNLIAESKQRPRYASE